MYLIREPLFNSEGGGRENLIGESKQIDHPFVCTRAQKSSYIIYQNSNIFHESNLLWHLLNVFASLDCFWSAGISILIMYNVGQFQAAS